MKKIKAIIINNWLFIFIIFLAVFFRLFHLGILPSTFHEDEVLSGYLGRYIINNGVDLYGNQWPFLYFNKFGDYYIILPMYLSGITSFFFGINEFSTRLPSAIAGILTTILIYYITLKIFKNKIISLIAAFLTAITPWFIVLSRSTSEGIIGCFLYFAALLFLIIATDRNSKKYFFLSGVFFLLSYFIYHPFRFYTPIIFIGSFVIYFSKLKDKKTKLKNIWIIFIIIFSLLTIYISSTKWGKARFIQTSIFSELSGVNIKNQQLIYDEGKNKIITARIFHNKITGYGRELLKQYITYYSPLFLFINGWDNTRYFVPENSLFYVSYIFLIIGLLYAINSKIFNKADKYNFRFLTFLTLISPFPAAFTVAGSPNPHRALFFGYLITIWLAVGFYSISKINYRNIKIIWFIVLLIFIEVIYFWHQYSAHVNTYSSVVRNDPQKQVSLFLLFNKSKYKNIYVPVEGAMAWYYLFYKKDFNIKYSRQFKLDARIDSIDNIHFIESSCPSTILKLNKKDYKKNAVLIIERSQCQAGQDYKLIDNIVGINPLLGYKVLIPKITYDKYY